MRDLREVYREFDRIVGEYEDTETVPVVCVHNLAYDVYFLMDYIDSKVSEGYTVDCCFKTSIKPLTISLVYAGDKSLIFWDTLSFSGTSLGKMGRQCGCLKAEGDWNYGLMRHAKTPLTEEEQYYALQDTVVPFEWLAYWSRLNPEIPLDQLALRILTKTSVVRYKCKQLAQSPCKYGGKTIYEDYLNCCRNESPKSPQDYALMIRSTSAGWTFTAGANAGKALRSVCKYDATSMHPSHMVSHKYPYDFKMLDPRDVGGEVEAVLSTPYESLLNDWLQPFKFAFNAIVEFRNIRPRRGTVFERDNLMLHGTALFTDYAVERLTDAEFQSEVMNKLNSEGYSNVAVNAVYSFGKLVSADYVRIALNELNAFVHGQVYEWDSCSVVEVSGTHKFRKPPEYVVLSVGTMLERKQIVKNMMHGVEYAERPEWIAENLWGLLCNGEYEHPDVKQLYRNVKSDLNSLYGMFATNEAKRDMVYENGDFVKGELMGFEKLPARPKAWYNFGLRIAAWSRVQQCVAMLTLDCLGIAEGFVNGDTDSFAFVATAGQNDDTIILALSGLHRSIEDAMQALIGTPLQGTHWQELGFYMEDCKPEVYCAVANKRYAYTDTEGGVHVASAGVPNASVAKAIGYELSEGTPFNVAVIRALGYCAGYGPKLSGSKYKAIPESYAERLESDFDCEDFNGEDYTYKKGSPVGLFLADNRKGLGEGFEDDYRDCCDNAGIEVEPTRYYDLTKEGGVTKYEPARF